MQKNFKRGTARRKYYNIKLIIENFDNAVEFLRLKALIDSNNL